MFKQVSEKLNQIIPGISRSLGWEVLLSVLSFPASILLNRTLGSQERGLLSLITLVPFTVLTMGGCQWDRLLKGLITSKQISGREAWRRTLYYARWLSLIFIPIGIIASLAFEKLSLSDRLLSVIYAIHFPIYFLAGSLAAIYIAIGSIDGQYLIMTTYRAGYLGLLGLLLLTDLTSVASLIFGYIGIHLLILGVGLFYKNKLLIGKLETERPSLSPLIQGFFPYTVESLSIQIDLWALSFFGSLISLGQYTAIAALMFPVGLISNAMNNASTAKLDWQNSTLVRQYLLKTISILSYLLVILIIGGITLAPYLLSFTLGKSFESGEWMIPWIAVIVVAKAAESQFHLTLQLSGLLNAYLKIQIIEPFVRAIIVFALAWFLSELGVFIGMAIASTIKICWCIFLHEKYRLKIS